MSLGFRAYRAQGLGGVGFRVFSIATSVAGT